MKEPPEGMPAYAGMLAARHAAHAAELTALVAGLPLPNAAAVLDVCCGDGFAAGRLADRGEVRRAVCLELRPGLLRWALDREAPRPLRPVAGDAERLPFADAAFDLVWCGQNLMTLRGSIDALAEMRRVLRPGGVLAVLESDRLHELRLPWPPALELAVHRAFADGPGAPLEVACVGRRVGDLLAEAGLSVVARRTLCTDRRGPFAPADRAFLESYLADIGESVRPGLGEEDRAAFDAHAAVGVPDSLLDRPGGWMTWTETLWLATS